MSVFVFPAGTKEDEYMIGEAIAGMAYLAELDAKNSKMTYSELILAEGLLFFLFWRPLQNNEHSQVFFHLIIYQIKHPPKQLTQTV